ncbi:RNA-guided endonuclease TnpB family protein [Armatimonas sp.]|uniref:RNA-guided endonuclease TnpB family protein n=1 Tax=Armatimonas sp. TaxID=1872638 RepID=UPI0037514C87
MLKAYKYRIYPTEEQEYTLIQQFGIGRFIYNWVFDQKKKEYKVLKAWRQSPVGDKPKSLSSFDYCKLLTTLKTEIDWLRDANAQALQQEIAHVFNAYSRFYKKLKERKARKQKLTNKKGRLLDFPRFKSKKDRQSLSFPQSVKVNFQAAWVQIPKVGKVPCVLSRQFTGTIKTATVSKETTGKYFVSVLIEDGATLPAATEPIESDAIGIDVGLTHFATFSTGEKIKNPRLLRRSLARLKKLQRSMARKKNRASKNGTSCGTTYRNYGKAKLRRALLEEHVANQRKDFLHKATHQLVCESQATTICVEELSVRNMMANHKLARSIADVSWGEFFRQLKYKTLWRGKNLLEVGRFEPSSKTCWCCGFKMSEMPLCVRVWECPGCRSVHDRDLNAAKNIVVFAFAKLGSFVNGLNEIPVGQPEIEACGQATSVTPCKGFE